MNGVNYINLLTFKRIYNYISCIENISVSTEEFESSDFSKSILSIKFLFLIKFLLLNIEYNKY